MILEIWRRDTARKLINYIDTPKRGGEVCVPIGSNFVPVGSPMAADRLMAIASRRPEVVKPFVHLVISPGSVDFDVGKWRCILREALERLDLSSRRHLYYAGLHVKQGRQHCHVAVCRVGIDRRVWVGEQERRRVVEVARDLAASFGTTSEYEDEWERAAPHRTVVQVNRILFREGRERIDVRNLVPRLTDCLTGSSTLADFMQAANRRGIELEFRREADDRIGGIRFVTATRRRHRLKLSKLTRGLFSLRTLEAYYNESSGRLRAHVDDERRQEMEESAEAPDDVFDEDLETEPDHDGESTDAPEGDDYSEQDDWSEDVDHDRPRD